MNRFSQVLVNIRSETGFRTSKAHYNYLKAKGLECNYQYYVKIESALVFPSSMIVNQIAKALSREKGELLIKAFCADQFENFHYLFEDTEIKKSDVSSALLSVNQGQKELSFSQIDCLYKKKNNYFLFLILTLSRSPLSLKDLAKYSFLKKSISDLVEISIAHLHNDTLSAASSEFIFPKIIDPKMTEIYATFDLWDREFSAQFEFENFLNKMMIRRISPRYFGVIQKQIEAFTDFVRCSDESDQRFNSEVIHLHISLSKGALPG